MNFLKGFKLSIILLAGLCVAIPQLGNCELTECNGVWSNKPCEGEVGKSLGAASKTKQQIDAPNQDQKDKAFAVAELDRFIFDAKRKLKQDISVSDIADFCSQETASLDDCREKISQRRLEVTTMLTKLDEKNAKSEPEVVIVDNTHNTNVVVIQENDYGHHRPRPSSTRSGLSPNFKPGPFGKPPLIKPPTAKLR